MHTFSTNAAILVFNSYSALYEYVPGDEHSGQQLTRSLNGTKHQSAGYRIHL